MHTILILTHKIDTPNKTTFTQFAHINLTNSLNADITLLKHTHTNMILQHTKSLTQCIIAQMHEFTKHKLISNLFLVATLTFTSFSFNYSFLPLIFFLLQFLPYILFSFVCRLLLESILCKR